MMRFSGTVLRLIGVAAILTGVVAATATSIAAASEGVTITSQASGSTDVYFDANHNGVNEASEFVGNFPIYTGSGIGFYWQPYTFPAGVNGSYYITLWQNVTPLDAQPTWVLRRAVHDFADNPAGTNYWMGPFFTTEHFCQNCPSMITVQLETYQNVGNVIQYTPLGENLSDDSTPSGFATSFGFVVQDVTNNGQPDKPAPGCPPAPPNYAGNGAVHANSTSGGGCQPTPPPN